jgi:hypothetical protein
MEPVDCSTVSKCCPKSGDGFRQSLKTGFPETIQQSSVGMVGDSYMAKGTLFPRPPHRYQSPYATNAYRAAYLQVDAKQRGAIGHSHSAHIKFDTAKPATEAATGGPKTE